MAALAASGDPANAVLLAGELRAFLAAELGVEPPFELAEAERKLREFGTLVPQVTLESRYLASGWNHGRRRSIRLD